MGDVGDASESDGEGQAVAWKGCVGMLMLTTTNRIDFAFTKRKPNHINCRDACLEYTPDAQRHRLRLSS